MKRLFFVSIALLLLLSFGQAQGKTGIEFGVKLGPNFSSWVGEDTDVSGDEEKKMKIGLHGGLFAVIPISGMLYFQPELLYSCQGVVFEEGDLKYTAYTSNLNIPLGLRIQSSGGFFGVVGPQVGFQIGGKEKYEFDDDEEKNDLEDLRGLILSGMIGAGYKTSSGFGGYIRYTRSFSSIFDYDDSKAFHSVFSLSLFYMFGGNKK